MSPYDALAVLPLRLPDTGVLRALITASRDWSDVLAIHDALELLESRAWPWRLLVVHGACRAGGDAIADDWCRGPRSWPQTTAERHPARWDVYGKGAGLARNVAMVMAGASVCLAFIGPCCKENCSRPQPHGSHGATHCAEQAELAGIPTIRWNG